ncbi:MAG: hypothetical protein GAK28_01989 [Luteibacter sp.]|uniref:hypothetical protein n=1 Tax=Luteibacter sp. TaxID=1886636 RepID=UPI0013849919|nr:hypothetical protein [Luteibacter sp.]KAF1007018.1 MAG: hypothetical protein GAK28_01989 [Luteibacter sp.]
MKPSTAALFKGSILIVACMVLAAAGVGWTADHAARARARFGLKASSEVVRDFSEQSWELLDLRGQLLANDQAFVDYVSQSLVPDAKLGGSVDKLSISRLLTDRRQGDDILALLDPEGMEVTSVGVIGKTADAVQHDPLVVAAISQGKVIRGIWLDNGRMSWVVIHPLMRGRTPQGYLLTVSQVTDTSLTKLARLARGDVALVSDIAPRTPLFYANGLDARYVNLVGKARGRLLDIKTTNGRPVILRDESLVLHAWVTPINAGQGQAAWVVMDPRAKLGRTVDAETYRILYGIAAFGLFGLLCVVFQWHRTWRPLDQLTDAFDRGRGDIGRVRGGPLMRDVRDRLDLASRNRR